MSFIRYFKKIEFLDSLIRKKATGSQREFAEKANISRSTLNEYLNEMRELKFPIKFDKNINSYYYEREGKFVTTFFEEKLRHEEMQNYKGGEAPLYLIEFNLLKSFF